MLWTLRVVVRRRHDACAATGRHEALELPALAFSSTTTPFMVVIAAFAGLQAFDLPPRIDAIARSVATVASFWQAGLWASTAAMAWLDRRAAGPDDRARAEAQDADRHRLPGPGAASGRAASAAS